MGKVRIKAFDESEQAEKDKKLEAKRAVKKSAKKAAKADLDKSEENTEESTKKDGLSTSKSEPKNPNETLPSSDTKHSEKSIAPTTVDSQRKSPKEESQPTDAPKDEVEDKKKTKKEKFLKKKTQSKKYIYNKGLVDKDILYPLIKAIEILKKFKLGTFDETVELHINVKEKGVTGQVVLPHGTGKTVRIKIVDDAVIADIEKGMLDFDVLVAHPQMMPKLARVARVLGPRGLMPNPKNGTITINPEEIIKKLQGGQITYKTEPQFPIIHLTVGKVSFEEVKLQQNVKTVLDSIGAGKISAAIIKSTMSPAIRLNTVKI